MVKSENIQVLDSFSCFIRLNQRKIQYTYADRINES